MKVINWQCQFTEHQYSTWLELQKISDKTITYVISGDIKPQQSWSEIDLSRTGYIPLTDKGWWKQGVGLFKKYPDAIHVFNGFLVDRRFLPLIIYAVWCGRQVAVMNEPYSTMAVGYMEDSPRLHNQLKVMLRPLIYRVIAIAIKSISQTNKFCILALSTRAVEQFQQAGFTIDQIFPFGYFVPKLTKDTREQTKEHYSVRFVFVGSLIKRKGLDLAVAAIETLHHEGYPISLDVFGYGNASQYIDPKSQCVFYKGTIPFAQVQHILTGYDALILPSLHDGWGVVINEALLQGIPVIVSSNVGAQCLVKENGAGLIFDSGNKDSLQEVLKEFISNPTHQNKLKAKAIDLSSLITPKNAARYLRDVFEFFFSGQGKRPKEIWRCHVTTDPLTSEHQEKKP